MLAAAPTAPISARVRLAVFGLVLLAATVFSIDRSAIPIAISLVCCIAAWFIVESPRGRPLPKLILNITVLVASIILWWRILMNLGDATIIIELGNFILVLILGKLFERKTRRDLAQIAILSLLLVIAGTMASSSGIIYAVLLVMYVGALIYTTMWVNLSFESEQALIGGRYSAALPDSGQMAAAKLDLRHITKRCMLLSLPIAAIVFASMPRTRSANLVSTWGVGATLTGYSETVNFANTGITELETVAMHVEITQDGESIGGEYNQPYFRGSVQDYYSIGPSRGRRWINRRWTNVIPATNRGPSTTSIADASVSATQPVPEPDPDPVRNVTLSGEYLDRLADDENLPIIVQKYRLFRRTENRIFAIATPVRISSHDFDQVTFDRQEVTLRVAENSTRPVSYTVHSAGLPTDLRFTPPPLPPGNIGLPHVRENSSTPMPNVTIDEKVDPRITTLAKEIAGDALPGNGQPLTADETHVIIFRLQSYLSNTYPYSLSAVSVDRNIDPTADFLFNRKETGGICTHFASAMVMMCRALGINARMVSGYHGGEYNSIAGYYVVREKHAHVWPEVWIPDTGWVVADPTPTRSFQSGSTSVLGRLIQELTQIVQSAWNSTFVGFDDASRASLVGWLNDNWTVIFGLATAWLSVMRDSFFGSSADMFFRATVLTLVALSIFLVVRVSRRRRALRRLAQKHPGIEPRLPVKLSGEIAFLDDLLKLLTRRGKEREADQTPREFLECHQSHLGGALTDARWLVQTAYALRFGGISNSPALKKQIAAKLRQVRETLRGPIPAPTPA